MNIAFNALSARAGAGIAVFQNLMPEIASLDKQNQYFIFVDKEQRDIINFIPDQFHPILLNNIPKNPFLRVAWEQIVLPFYIRKYKINLLYSVGNTTILLAPCKVLLFIENPNPFTKIIKKWNLKDKIRNKLLFVLGWISSIKAARIRFCSYRSMEIISKIYRINQNKCFVLYHGLSKNWFDYSIEKSFLKYNYILTVSVVVPHKNFEVLFRAFQRIKKENQYKGKLLIIGDIDAYKDYYNNLVKLISELTLNGEIIFLGKIPNNKLKSYYQHADLFVFPSLEETFGIPLIEALVSGVPVIASDGRMYKDLFIPFNELAEDLAVYFDPFSEEDLANQIICVLNKKMELIEKIRSSLKKLENKFFISLIAEQLLNEFKNISNQESL